MSAESLELGSLLPPDSSTVDEDYSAKIERHLKRLFCLQTGMTGVAVHCPGPVCGKLMLEDR